MSALELFHFLRPWLLLLILPSWLMVWWLLRHQNDMLRWKKLVDSKLLAHLLITPEQNPSKIQAPIHLGIVWTLIVVALAGPAWQLKPPAFTQDEAQIVFVVKVTQSMQTKDLTPSRLKRAQLKMKDLMDLRPDIKTALVAYSGSAHLVLPLTHDHAVLTTFAQSLAPDIMPEEGDRPDSALILAAKQFESGGGTIIVLSDSADPSQVQEVAKSGLPNDPKVLFFAVVSKELLNQKTFEQSASALKGEYQPITADEYDVSKLSSMINQAFKGASAKEDSHYEDGGYLLIPIIMLGLLLWFRRGFIAEAWRVS